MPTLHLSPQRKNPPAVTSELSSGRHSDAPLRPPAAVDLEMAAVTDIEKLVAQGRFDLQLELLRKHWASVWRLFLDEPDAPAVLRSMALGLHSQDTVLADPMAQGGTNSPLLVRGQG